MSTPWCDVHSSWWYGHVRLQRILERASPPPTAVIPMPSLSSTLTKQIHATSFKWSKSYCTNQHLHISQNPTEHTGPVWYNTKYIGCSVEAIIGTLCELHAYIVCICVHAVGCDAHPELHFVHQRQHREFARPAILCHTVDGMYKAKDME